MLQYQIGDCDCDLFVSGWQDTCDSIKFYMASVLEHG